jgi:hypothetical protein
MGDQKRGLPRLPRFGSNRQARHLIDDPRKKANFVRPQLLTLQGDCNDPLDAQFARGVQTFSTSAWHGFFRAIKL